MAKRNDEKYLFDYFSVIPQNSLVVFMSKDPGKLAQETMEGTRVAKLFKDRNITGFIINAEVKLDILSDEDLSKMGLMRDPKTVQTTAVKH